MPGKKIKSSAEAPPSSGYSQVAKTVLQEGASRVQEIHAAIAGKSFDLLKNIPLLNAPAQLVQRAHNAIAGGVYATIRHGGGSLLDIAGRIEQHGFRPDPSAPTEPPSRLVSHVRSALNAAFGDHFAETDSVLAIPMRLHLDGRAIPLERAALAAAYPTGGDRLCLFIHGLGCDEHCWESAGGEQGMPRQLAADTGYTALTLRYNTGLPIAENGAQLAMLLEELLKVWPSAGSIRELVLIGHSMGGLLARSACSQAATAGFAWLARTRMVVCLASPHLGSPLEKLGELTTTALRLSTITAPLARIAAQRSQGIQDLRHGLGTHAADSPPIAWRFIGGCWAEDPNTPFGQIIGDGLVTLGSATAHAPNGDVQSRQLGGVGHMELLKDARVYAQIRAWLEASATTLKESPSE